MEIKHPFNSTKGDGPDSTRVRPSNWNANHNMTISQANRYIGRDKSGAGAAQELPVVPIASADDGTIWTAAKVQEYVAQQISGAAGGGGVPMGAIVGSIVGTMPGFLPLNGNTFGRVGSSSVYESALYQNLYMYMWSLVTPAIIVEGGKGASALDDWNNGKSMFLPQSAGCVLGAQGIGGPLDAAWLTVVGADNVNIAVDQLPAHTHGFPPGPGSVRRSTNSGNGATGSGNVLFDDLVITETASTGSGNSHPNVQRTMIVQVFWIKY